MSDLYFTDAEVDEMTEGLTQDAAKIRYLRSLGLRVHRKPNGRPLAWKPAVQASDAAPSAPQSDESIVVDLQGWAAGRKSRHGQKTQGR